MKFFILSLMILVVLIIFVRRLEQRSIFFPDKEIKMTPGAIGLIFEDIYFKTEDGVLLNGWFVPSSVLHAKTILFAHGNAGNISDRLGRISLFHRIGLNVFIFDYRGYGKSDGIPSEEGLYQDIRAAYDYLREEKKMNPDHIVACGASLGGSIVIDLAVHRKIAALIVEATFTSGKDMAKIFYPFIPSIMIKTQLNSLEKVKGLRMPKLFMHPVMDEIVPFALGEKLYMAALEPKSFVRLLGGHNDAYQVDEQRYIKSVRDFLGI